ncbi:hypothetical protein LTR85_005691 [Meristemomyces frigidus]|nr:hypothetical protein LTR85_005691 [Meristemomyces frigidus]
MKLNREQITAPISFVTWDEFHVKKTASTQPVPAIIGLLGMPPVLGISATPLAKMQQLSTIFTAGYGKYMKSTHGTTSRPFAYTVRTPAEMSGQLHTSMRPGLLPSHKKLIVVRSYIGKDKSAKLIDKYMAGSTLRERQKAVHHAKPDSDGENNSPDEDNNKAKEPIRLVAATAVAQDEATAAAIDVSVKWLRPHMIQINPDFTWKPLADREGMPAIEQPPHSGFDVTVTIEDKYQDTLGRYWTDRLAKTSELEFFGLIHEFRTLILWPCLYDLMQEDQQLRNELGNFDKTIAATITRAGVTSRVWRYMPLIHASEAMATVHQMLSQFRSQLNWAGYGRKVVFVGHKPFNIALLNLYMKWLVGQTPPRCPELTDVDDFVMVDTWSSDGANADNVTDFVTTMHQQDGY